MSETAMDLMDVELKEGATDTDLYTLAGRGKKEQDREGKWTTEPKTESKMTKLQKIKKREYRGRTESNTGTTIPQT